MLIHKMRLDDYKAVLDVNSGAVHLVDDLIYDLLDVFNGENGEEAINAMKGAMTKRNCVKPLKN
jgi:uncharacterized protein